ATVQEVSGADKITRYNMFTAADLSGQPAPGASTGDALTAVDRLAKQILPTSFTTEWTEIALQQKLAGNSAIYIFPLCVLFVFLRRCSTCCQFGCWRGNAASPRHRGLLRNARSNRIRSTSDARILRRNHVVQGATR